MTTARRCWRRSNTTCTSATRKCLNASGRRQLKQQTTPQDHAIFHNHADDAHCAADGPDATRGSASCQDEELRRTAVETPADPEAALTLTKKASECLPAPTMPARCVVRTRRIDVRRRGPRRRLVFAGPARDDRRPTRATSMGTICSTCAGGWRSSRPTLTCISTSNRCS